MIHRRSLGWPVGGVLLVLTLLGLALRVWNIGGQTLLPDEGSSIFFARLPLSTLACSLCDPHPPGFYLLLALWQRLTDSEGWLRLPSVLAGTLAIPLTWLVARTVLRPLTADEDPRPGQVGLLAAALLAAAPIAVWYSREIRPYALLALLALALVWAGLRWRLHPDGRHAAAYLVTGWLALGTEYGALGVCFLLNLWLLTGWPWRATPHRADWPRRWLALQAALLLPFGLWWALSAQPQALRQMSYQAIFLAVQSQKLGVDWTPATARGVIVLVGAMGAALAAGLALLIRRSPRVRAWLRGPVARTCVILALIALSLLGMLPRLYTVKRHLNVLLPLLTMAAAWAVLWPQRRRAWLPGSGLVTLLLALSAVMLMIAPRVPWREVVTTLAQQARPGDTIWVDELDAPAFGYYWDERGPWQPLRARDLAALTRTSAAGRTWLVGSVTPYRDLRQTLPASFAAQHIAATAFSWEDTVVTAYVATPEVQTSAEPPLPLRWGLAIQSPLDVVCR